MRRMLTIAAMFVLALPNLAAAEELIIRLGNPAAQNRPRTDRWVRRIPAVRIPAEWRVRTAAR